MTTAVTDFPCPVKGDPEDTKELVDWIVEVMVSTLHPDLIYMFGSAARGNLHPQSDLDFLLIFDRPVDRRSDWLSVRQALRQCPRPLDIVLMPRAEFETQREWSGTLARCVAREGVLLHELGVERGQIRREFSGVAAKGRPDA